MQLWQALDVTCSDRVKDWKQPTLIKFCNIWYKNHLAKVNFFSLEIISQFKFKFLSGWRICVVGLGEDLPASRSTDTKRTCRGNVLSRHLSAKARWKYDGS